MTHISKCRIFSSKAPQRRFQATSTNPQSSVSFHIRLFLSIDLVTISDRLVDSALFLTVRFSLLNYQVPSCRRSANLHINFALVHCAHNQTRVGHGSSPLHQDIVPSSAHLLDNLLGSQPICSPSVFPSALERPQDPCCFHSFSGSQLKPI